MARRVDALLQKTIALPPAERQEFLRRLRVTLRPDEFEEAADVAWLSEIESRLADFDAGRLASRSAAASLATLRRSIVRPPRRAR
jgi:hypothetical protein